MLSLIPYSKTVIILLLLVTSVSSLSFHAQNEKVAKLDFESWIQGKWKMTAFSIEGNARNPHRGTRDFRGDKMVLTDANGTIEYSWEYFEESGVIIYKHQESGNLFRHKILMQTQDSSRYEYITTNGRSVGTLVKMKP